MNYVRKYILASTRARDPVKHIRECFRRVSHRNTIAENFPAKLNLKIFEAYFVWSGHNLFREMHLSTSGLVQPHTLLGGYSLVKAFRLN